MIFAVISTLLYPSPYRNDWSDLRGFFRSYVLGKNFQLSPIGLSREESWLGRALRALMAG